MTPATAQNRSAAVMNQRIDPPDALDFFPTPPWATRAVLREIAKEELNLREMVALDPACGEGDMVRPLAEAFGKVEAADIHHYGKDFPPEAQVVDFLDTGLLAPKGSKVDWIFANPPFNKADDFVWQALGRARIGVAFLVRSNFAAGASRYRSIYSGRPPSFELVMCERVVMAKGRLRDPKVKYRAWDAENSRWVAKTPSTATDYSWFVWFQDGRPGPCQKRWSGIVRDELTRPGDYPPLPPDERIPDGGLI